MAKMSREEKLVQTVKKIVIGLVVLAVLVFLTMSARIFNVSVSNSDRYQSNYNKLSSSEKSMVKSMKKTGEVQSKVMGSRRSTGGNGRFLDEVEKIHSKDKKNK
ncbi:MAG: hypothetical protein K6G80_08830 [Treponema sp.]|nr:hypothetical protein [Treponema sp.]